MYHELPTSFDTYSDARHEHESGLTIAAAGREFRGSQVEESVAIFPHHPTAPAQPNKPYQGWW